jgi:hypothetical protein
MLPPPALLTPPPPIPSLEPNTKSKKSESALRIRVPRSRNRPSFLALRLALCQPPTLHQPLSPCL